MRHEAKLNFFKQASHLINFKNVEHAPSHHHQRWMCYHLASGRLINASLECEPSFSGSGITLVKDETQDIQEKLNLILLQLGMEALVYHPKWVCKNGILY